MDEISDSELVYYHRRQDYAAYQILYARYQRLITKTINDASYSYQNNLYQFSDYKQIADLTFDYCINSYCQLASFKNYYFICLNKRINNILRKLRSGNCLLNTNAIHYDITSASNFKGFASDCPKEMFLVKEFEQKYLNALQKLTGEQKKLWVLKSEGYSYKEIASKTGLNLKQIDYRLYKIRNILKTLLIDVC